MPERAILYLAVAQTLIWASASYVFAALLLWWEADLGWSRLDLTWAFTLALLLSAFAAPVSGRIIDRGYGAVMMGISTVVAGLLIAGLSLVQAQWQFYLIWGAIGIMLGGCLYEPCFALITRARGAAGKPGIVVITLFAGFASTISFPLGHFLAGEFGWRIAVLVFAAIAIFVAAPLMYAGARAVGSEYKEPEQGMVEPETKPSRSGFLHRPQFWLLGLAFGLGSTLQGLTISHLLAILDERGIPSALAVFTASMIGPMQVAGRIAMVAGGRFASNHVVAVMSFSAMALSALTLFMAQGGLPVLLLFAVLFGGAHGVVSIIRPMLTLEILGQNNFGAKSGALAVFFFSGAAFAPSIGSLIWQAAGYDTVIVCLFAMGTGGLVLYLLARRFPEESPSS